MKVIISKHELEKVYNQGLRTPEMVDYFNNQYGSDTVKFTVKRVKAMYESIGLDLRKKPRQSFEVVIEDIDGVRNSEIETEELINPYLTENLI
jgi:hypothetical protein